ncbi:MAG: site-2 protease family protein [Longimicrobiales bacterium]|nr:site-2 protease family protein [Longimicrobiales bacterium]
MRGIRLGSVFGLEIRIDYSWFIIFFLILWTLAGGVFPQEVQEAGTGVHVAMGVAGTILFFVSLLAHEISHSLVAQRRDIPVEGITLFIFGGMAHTRMEAEDPGDEFVIAGVGPLASLVIAGLFGLAGWAGRAAGLGPEYTAVADYLAYINVALAVFNLLPGFPLDGGRLFRAAVWKLTDDLRKATRWATTGGKTLGYALIGFGLLQLFGGGGGGGLWLIFIGWFVRTAAESSFRQHVLRQSLEDVAVRELMTPDPETVPADLSLQEFVDDRVMSGAHRAYPVVQDSAPVGMIALDQVKDIPRDHWPDRTVGDVMTGDPETVSPDANMADVLERLGGREGIRLLVLEDGELVGLVTRGDLTRWIERAELLQ